MPNGSVIQHGIVHYKISYTACSGDRAKKPHLSTMCERRNFATYPVLIAFLLLVVPHAYGQSDDAVADSAFSALVERVRGGIQKYEQADQPAKADSVERAYAQELFKFYLRHTDTEAGSQAVHRAFLMWGNTGAAPEVKGALARLDTDSRVWSLAFPGVRKAYDQSEKKTENDYIDLLKQFRDTLSHARSRSALRFELAESYMSSGQEEKAARLYQQVVSMNADSIMVQLALNNLHEMESLSVGQEAPLFESTTVSGDTIALADFRGEVVLLEFWATWCGPCLPEIPYFKDVWSEYRGDDFQLIGISLDESIGALKEFIEAENITWPQIQQERGSFDEVTEMYSVNGIPRTYLIDRKGTIVAKDFRQEEIEKEVRRLMEGSEE